MIYDSINAIINSSLNVGVNVNEIQFYEQQDGPSELWDFLEELRIKGQTIKNYRVQYRQFIYYIELLRNNGTNLPNTIVRHLHENIYELRPGNNRILFFYYAKNTYVLLHYFRKKTRKTPLREIDKAKKE